MWGLVLIRESILQDKSEMEGRLGDIEMREEERNGRERERERARC